MGILENIFNLKLGELKYFCLLYKYIKVIFKMYYVSLNYFGIEFYVKDFFYKCWLKLNGLKINL